MAALGIAGRPARQGLRDAHPVETFRDVELRKSPKDIAQMAMWNLGGVTEIKPAFSFVGVEDMDKEQIQLGSSDKFWKLIRERRSQRTTSRAVLEQRMKKEKSRDGKHSRQIKRASR